MTSWIQDALQVAITVLAILLTVAILLDLRGRPGVPSAEIEQLFRTTIELLMLVLYRIAERVIYRRLSRPDATLGATNETASGQQDKRSSTHQK